MPLAAPLNPSVRALNFLIISLAVFLLFVCFFMYANLLMEESIYRQRHPATQGKGISQVDATSPSFASTADDDNDGSLVLKGSQALR